MFNKTVSPLVFVFLIVGALILLFRNRLEQFGADWQVLSGGNLFIYVVTIVSMHLLSKGLHATQTHAFIRNAYSGILVKLFACAIAAFIYIAVAGSQLNKKALFILMGLYLVYSFVEMWIIIRESKQKKNG
jgi:hypothetical protein